MQRMWRENENPLNLNTMKAYRTGKNNFAHFHWLTKQIEFPTQDQRVLELFYVWLVDIQKLGPNSVINKGCWAQGMHILTQEWKTLLKGKEPGENITMLLKRAKETYEIG